MAVSFVAVEAVQFASDAGSGDLSVTPAIPAGATTDDLILVGCLSRSSSGSADMSSSGYVVATDGSVSAYNNPNSGNGNNRVMKILYRFHDGSEADPSILFTNRNSGSLVGAAIAVYRGVDSSDPFHQVLLDFNNTAAATFSTDDLTADAAGQMAIDFVTTNDDNALDMTTDEGFTVRMDGAAYDTSLGNDGSFGWADDPIAAGGAVPYPVWTQTVVGNDTWASIGLILNPTPSAPATTYKGGLLVSNQMLLTPQRTLLLSERKV